jgi:hypothetical protein
MSMGYDIGASSSDAWSIPQTSNSQTIINYGAGSSFLQPVSQSVTSEPVAVSTTKSPGTQVGIGGTGGGGSTGGNAGNPFFPGDQSGVTGGISTAINSKTLLYIGIGSILALLILRR